MSLESKTLWYEGMFLNPQHFQQQERYFERYIDGKCTAYGAYGWGLQEIELNHELLKLGKLGLIKAKGVFPDGTPVNFPDIDEAPPVLEVPAGTSHSIVYLSVPVRRPGAMDVVSEEDNQGLARYYSHKQEIRDVTLDSAENLSLDVGKLRLRLLLESDDRSGYACIGILRINEASDNKEIKLDERYIATCLDCNVSQNLSGFISELTGMLHYRAEAIAGRLAETHRGGTAEVADYMMLQLINRIEPLCLHLTNMNGLHPLDLYTRTIQMAGELATFVTKRKRPGRPFPPYLHDDLQTTFMPVMSALRDGLRKVYEQTAIALKLAKSKFGIYVSQIEDRSLIGTAMFVLAVRADVTPETLRTKFPTQMKISSVDRIRQIVNAGIRGIPLEVLTTSPREISHHSGFIYFELDRQSKYWKELRTTGGMAIHVGGDFPNIELELWAIRRK